MPVGLVTEQECRATEGVQVHFIYDYGAQSGDSLAKVSGARADIDLGFLEVDSHECREVKVELLGECPYRHAALLVQLYQFLLFLLVAFYTSGESVMLQAGFVYWVRIDGYFRRWRLG